MILQAVEHPNLFPTGEGGAVKAQHTTRCPEEDAPLPKRDVHHMDGTQGGVLPKGKQFHILYIYIYMYINLNIQGEKLPEMQKYTRVVCDLKKVDVAFTH